MNTEEVLKNKTEDCTEDRMEVEKKSERWAHFSHLLCFGTEFSITLEKRLYDLYIWSATFVTGSFLLIEKATIGLRTAINCYG